MSEKNKADFDYFKTNPLPIREEDSFEVSEENDQEIVNESKALFCFSKMYVDEIKTNCKMAFPVMITNIFQYSLIIETTAFCGRLTSTELEGVGLALSLVSALGWCVCTGMVSACDTMFAQSFGSNDKKRTGLFLQRGLLLMNLIPICLWALHVNFEPILILLGQDPKVSRVTGEFLIIFLPGLSFMMNYLLLARYMQDQGCLWPPVLAGICGNIFNICFQLLFVIYLNYGFKASAVCHALSFGLMFLIELFYIKLSKFYIPTWPGFQLEALNDWSGMFTLGLAGVGHITFEVIIWEAGVFMGGLIGTVQLAAQSIILQLLTLMFMLYYGAGIASNIRVGQCLGANRPHQAKLAYRAGLLTTGTATLLVASLIIGLYTLVPHVFTDKEDVIKIVTETLPFAFLIFYSDPFSGVFSATLRGCGRQFSGCLIMFVAFYILCLPTGVILAFVAKVGIKGIWIANTIGSIVSVSSQLILIECQDWNKQAHLAQKRIHCSLSQTDETETERLLPSLQMERERGKTLLSHIRTPSHPIMCSTDMVKLPKVRSKVGKSTIIKRCIVALCVLIFFLFGLSIHVFLPTEIYRSKNATNAGF